MEEFLELLGIRQDGEITEDSYSDHFTSSAKFAKLSNLLSDSDEVECIDEESHLDTDGAEFIYENDNYSISLLGDFNEDNYSLTIVKI